MNHPRQEKVLDVLGVVTLVVTVGVLILAAVAVPVIFDTSSTASEVRDANEAAACADHYRAQVLEASAAVTAAVSRLELITNSGLEASIRENTPGLQGAVDASPDARSDVLGALADLDLAVQESSEAAELSVADPEAFLELCRST